MSLEDTIRAEMTMDTAELLISMVSDFQGPPNMSLEQFAIATSAIFYAPAELYSRDTGIDFDNLPVAANDNPGLLFHNYLKRNDLVVNRIMDLMENNDVYSSEIKYQAIRETFETPEDYMRHVVEGLSGIYLTKMNEVAKSENVGRAEIEQVNGNLIEMLRAYETVFVAEAELIYGVKLQQADNDLLAA